MKHSAHSWLRFSCPDCGEHSIPRWEGAQTSAARVARCKCCREKSRKREWLNLWSALVVTLAPVSFVPIFFVAFIDKGRAYVLGSAVCLGLVVLLSPAWIVPLRQAREHEGESVLPSFRRHFGRRKDSPPNQQ
jgi:hypothetical protein